MSCRLLQHGGSFRFGIDWLRCHVSGGSRLIGPGIIAQEAVPDAWFHFLVVKREVKRETKKRRAMPAL
jgi:hypothetical protein